MAKNNKHNTNGAEQSKNKNQHGGNPTNKDRRPRHNGGNKSNQNKRRNNSSNGRGTTDTTGRESNSTNDISSDTKAVACHNDPSWWNKFPERTQYNAQVNTRYPMGSTFQLGEMDGKKVTYTQPGLMTMHCVSAYPIRGGMSDPVNQQFNQMFNQVRKAISGNYKNYEPVDLAIHSLAVVEFYAAYNWAQRLLSCVNAYSSYNFYTPGMLVEANGVDFEDLKYHRMEFASNLLNIASRASVLFIPGTMDLFKRRAFLYSTILAEKDIQAQLYMYVPDKFMKLHYNESTGKAELIPIDVFNPDRLMSSIEVIDLLEDLLNAILTDEDCMFINGDLDKAFPGNNLSFVPGNLESQVLVDIKGEDMDQLLNTVIVEESLQNLKLGTDTTGSYLVGNPYIARGDYTDILTLRYPIRVITDDFSPANIVHATRTMTLGEVKESSVRLICGTEIVTRCYMYSSRYNSGYYWDNPTHYNRIPYPRVVTLYSGTAWGYNDAYRAETILRNAADFRNRPMQWIAVNDATEGTTYVPYVESYTVGFVDPETFRGIEDVALQSIFAFSV